MAWKSSVGQSNDEKASISRARNLSFGRRKIAILMALSAWSMKRGISLWQSAGDIETNNDVTHQIIYYDTRTVYDAGHLSPYDIWYQKYVKRETGDENISDSIDICEGGHEIMAHVHVAGNKRAVYRKLARKERKERKYQRQKKKNEMTNVSSIVKKSVVIIFSIMSITREKT